MICSPSEILVHLGLAATATPQQAALVNLLLPKAERAVKTYLQNDLEYGLHVEYLPLGNRFEDRDTFVDLSIRGNTVTLIPGTRNNRIVQLKHTPVWLTSFQVWEDSGGLGDQAEWAFPESTLLVDGVDYYLDCDGQENDGASPTSTNTIDICRTGHVIRIGNWAITPRCIKFSYNAGWTAAHFDGIVSDIKQAVILTAIKSYWQAWTLLSNNGMVPSSESLGHYSQGFNQRISQVITGLGASLPPEAMLLVQPYRNYGRSR